MSQEAQPQTKGKSGRKEKNDLPLILTMGMSRSSASLKVHCEALDAKTYSDYIQYTYEAQPIKGHLSRQEIEERFNAVAWSAIWRKDAAFREWVKGRLEASAEG